MNEKQVTKYTMWVQFGKRQRLVWQVIAQLCLILLDPMSVALQALLPIGFSRQEYWSRLPFPPSGHLVNPGIEAGSPASPALAGGSFTAESPGSRLDS